MRFETGPCHVPEARKTRDVIQSYSTLNMDDNADCLMVTIRPQLAPWQRSVLVFWVAAWFILGLYMIMYSFSLAGEERLMVFIYLAFWAYFLYTSARSLLWHQIGTEFIKVENGEVSYKRSWRGYGKAHLYDGENIHDIEVIAKNNKSIAQSFGEVFWSYGGEKLVINYLSRRVAFGMKLQDKDAEKLARKLKRSLHKKK